MHSSSANQFPQIGCCVRASGIRDGGARSARRMLAHLQKYLIVHKILKKKLKFQLNSGQGSAKDQGLIATAGACMVEIRHWSSAATPAAGSCIL